MLPCEALAGRASGGSKRGRPRGGGDESDGHEAAQGKVRGQVREAFEQLVPPREVGWKVFLGLFRG